MALQNNGQVYKDPEMLYLTASQLDPMNALREKFRKEFQAEKESYLNPEQDFGPSVQDRVVTASTSSISAITVK